MVIYFKLKDGYVNGWGSTSSGDDDEIKLEVSDGHEVLRNPEIFKYEDGELIKDEERQKELKEEAEKEDNGMSIEDQNSVAILELAESLLKGGK